MAQRESSLRVLSLGAGVQSTTLALMAVHGRGARAICLSTSAKGCAAYDGVERSCNRAVAA